MHTDANMIAGLLQDVFATDVTACERMCQSCGREHPVGAHRLYTGAGYVLRCPGCGDIAACIATLPGQYAISLRGTWLLDRSD
jgi:Family of unknown function (DUF6510)